MAHERINSIDALRAVTLLGILIIHSGVAFGWATSLEYTAFGDQIEALIKEFLTGRCRIIFRLLFGVSLYWVLRHPDLPRSKYVWRCFLLCLIGLFNKIFFTNDVLLWYGIWGMVLTSFRNLSTKQIWVSFITFFTLNLIITQFFDLKTLVFGNDFVYDRYDEGKSLWDALSYPVWRSVYHKLTIRINEPFDTFSMFLLGFYLAESGIIDNLKKHVTVKNFIIFTIFYVPIAYLGLHFQIPALKKIGYIFGSFSYALLFLLLYYKTYPFFRFLEPYGKLGLTNYSMQGIVGVVLGGLLFAPRHLSIVYFILTMVLFFFVQLAFSTIWLKHYKHGPFEWVWRCGIERRWLKNKL